MYTFVPRICKIQSDPGYIIILLLHAIHQSKVNRTTVLSRIYHDIIHGIFILFYSAIASDIDTSLI